MQHTMTKYQNNTIKKLDNRENFKLCISENVHSFLIEILNKPITIEEISKLIKDLPSKVLLGLDCFTI